ncbi:MAG: hypothetical protein Q9165_003858 [Trypethelium subeluteriae]
MSGIAEELLLKTSAMATLNLDDLPQGLIVRPKDDHNDRDDAPEYPTVLRGVQHNMRNAASSRIRMGLIMIEEVSGFQYQYLVKYLRILVMDLKKHVAISEEYPNAPADRAKPGGLNFDRKVERIVTAGTLIDEDFLDPDKNNYLLSIHLSHGQETEKLGIAWLDLSSSSFFVQSIDTASLPSALARISPSEVVLDSVFERNSPENPVISILKENRCGITWHKPSESVASSSDWSGLLERPLTEDEVKKLSPEEEAAAGLALHYIQDRLPKSDVKLQPPIRQSEYLSVDRYSINALEIKSTLRDGLFKGSLLHVLRKTVTRSGSRLLTNRLLWPSLTLPVIDDRLNLVETFLQDAPLRHSIQQLLKRAFDASRLLTKFSLGRADADDLLGLSKTIGVTGDVVLRIKESQESEDELDKGTKRDVNAVSRLIRRIDTKIPKALASHIAAAIDEDGLSEKQFAETGGTDTGVFHENGSTSDPASSKTKSDFTSFEIDNGGSTYARIDPSGEPWIMRRRASSNLNRLHKSLDQLWAEQGSLIKDLQQKLGAPTVILKMTPGMGHFCHLKHKTPVRLIDKLTEARLVSSSKSTASFHYPAWSQLGERMEIVRMGIRAEEQNIFARLCQEVSKQLNTLRRNAAVLDELDVACSYATVASERNWVRPILNNGTAQTILGGRHPMVDLGLEEKGVGFTANDCRMDSKEKLLFITGPNMAGKSTYLRQNALITILAQTGSFVPAMYAELGLVDKVFSRVGSADNLSRDQSTFMVEMLESAEILKNATERSFVIMDEVGRGTTPEDGIALGFASLDHLARINKCRALFATHFHVLADMTKGFGNVGYYCTDVLEDRTGFSYIHRLRPGVNRRSHALKVAELAGE